MPASIISNDEPINVIFDKTCHDTIWGYEDAAVNSNCRFPANVYYLLPGQKNLPDSDNYWVPEDESALHDDSIMTQVYFTPHEDADRAVVTLGLFNGKSVKETKITFYKGST